MEKMIVADKTELTIASGHGINDVTAIAEDWEGLEMIANAIMKPKNLDTVQFKTGEEVTGEYIGLMLETPLFHTVDVKEDGKIHATFKMREKTNVEKRLDALETGQEEFKESQDIQDGAIMEMAEMLGGTE